MADPFALNPDEVVARLSLTNHAVERYQQRFDGVPADVRAAREHLRRRLERGVLVVSATPPRDARLAREEGVFFLWQAHDGLTLPCVVDPGRPRPFVARTVIDRHAADERARARRRAPRPARTPVRRPASRPARGWRLRPLPFAWVALIAWVVWLLLGSP